VQLDAVEARHARAACRLGEQRREGARQLADVSEMQVGDPLAVAHPQALEIARAEHASEGVVVEREQRRTGSHAVGLGARERGVTGLAGQTLAERRVYGQELAEKPLARGTALDGEKVDDLDERRVWPALASRTAATSSQSPGT